MSCGTVKCEKSSTKCPDTCTKCQICSSTLLLSATGDGTTTVPAATDPILPTNLTSLSVVNYSNIDGYGTFSSSTFTATRAGLYEICGSVPYSYTPALQMTRDATTLIRINGIVVATSVNDAPYLATQVSGGQICTRAYLNVGSTVNLAGLFANYPDPAPAAAPLQLLVAEAPGATFSVSALKTKPCKS
jgi:hypothetical protein